MQSAIQIASIGRAAAEARMLLRPRALRLALWMALMLALPAVGRPQQGGSGQFPAAPPHGFPQPDNSPFSPADGSNPVEAEKRQRLINDERQKSLVADTNRLLALATELRKQIAKSNTGELTPEQLRKVAEIEKLAHSVKDKMSMSLRGPTLNLDSPVFLPSPH
jgi:hypothetical protein